MPVVLEIIDCPFSPALRADARGPNSSSRTLPAKRLFPKEQGRRNLGIDWGWWTVSTVP
jgi:hypothetical protein